MGELTVLTAMASAAGGYLIGSMPTADLVARLAGIDLRTTGSGNPGATNALRLGGARIGGTVLALGMLKGIAGALLGRALGGDVTALIAAIATPLGQILNPWFGFRGGKGLAVTGGATLVVWPLGALPAMIVLAAGARITRSAARGALIALGYYVAGTIVWVAAGLPNGWGVEPSAWMAAWGALLAVVLAPKFVVDLT